MSLVAEELNVLALTTFTDKLNKSRAYLFHSIGNPIMPLHVFRFYSFSVVGINPKQNQSWQAFVISRPHPETL